MPAERGSLSWVHAGIDWDREMPAVTLAALFCGAGVLVASRRDRETRVVSPAVRAGLLAATLALAVVVLVRLAARAGLGP